MSVDQEKRFDGQVAIVTGSSAGMGREHAKLLAARGASVLVNGLTESAVDETVRIIEDAGGTATASYDDISVQSGAEALVASAIDHYGRLDILISNAGVYREVPFADMTFSEFDAVMKVNTYGAFFVTKAAWPHLIDQSYGRVLLVGSAAGLVSQANASHYATSKGAIVGLGRTLAAEGAAHGINVNILLPAAATRMGAKALSTAETDKARELVQRLMPVSLVAPVAAWLVHRDNTLRGEIIETGSGRAAVNFTGSGTGFWSETLSIEDLFEHQQAVLEQDGYRAIKTAPEVADWMVENSHWPAEMKV
ncbi:SDR family NAD(P)-dependent oxidoreductase [Nocardia nova]|uniref:SDR family NAD(P)-dependent oxidoreductase n=1 Tax=Nocardia nova TaxID=37330 RepID=UPI0033D32D25